MTILQKFTSRGIRFRKKRDELLYQKFGEINDEVVEDIKAFKEEILKALDDEKEEWVKLRNKEKHPHIREWINNIIKDTYE